VRGAGDAEDATDDDRHPRHARLVDRRERTGAVADRACPLRRRADQEARLVDEVHARHVERVAEVDETGHLLRRRPVEPAAAMERIAREDADREAVEPREARGERPAEVAADLEERVAVDDQPHELPRVVAALSVPRHDRQQRLLAPHGIVARLAARRDLPDVRRQVREEAADLRERVVLALGLVVDDAVPRVDVRATERRREARRSSPSRRRSSTG